MTCHHDWGQAAPLSRILAAMVISKKSIAVQRAYRVISPATRIAKAPVLCLKVNGW
jgi:hypothetical protein